MDLHYYRNIVLHYLILYKRKKKEGQNDFGFVLGASGNKIETKRASYS